MTKAKSKYTPGPHYAGTATAAVFAGPEDICIGLMDTDAVSPEEELANARLFAAASEMHQLLLFAALLKAGFSKTWLAKVDAVLEKVESGL